MVSAVHKQALATFVGLGKELLEVWKKVLRHNKEGGAFSSLTHIAEGHKVAKMS
jgi:hypothetical protein